MMKRALCITPELPSPPTNGLPSNGSTPQSLRLICAGEPRSTAMHRGLLWFLDRVWPKLLVVHPELEIDVACNSPDAGVRSRADLHPGIRLHEAAGLPEASFERAAVAVAPILSGEAGDAAVLETMARGVPTVTTPQGAREIPCVDRLHLAVALDASSMADRILELLRDRDQRARMSRASRELVAQRYPRLVAGARFLADCNANRDRRAPEDPGTWVSVCI